MTRKVCNDNSTRLAVLRAISIRPQHALSYGTYEGKTILDRLLEEARVKGSLVYRKSVMAALVHYDDPRVVDCFLETFENSEDSALVMLAARRLSLEKTPRVQERLKEALLGEDPRRYQCAAEVWQQESPTSAQEALRLFLLGRRELEAMLWQFDRQDLAEAWLHELKGSLVLRARHALEATFDQALPLLLEHQDNLDAKNQEWFFKVCATRSWDQATIDTLKPYVDHSSLKVREAAAGLLIHQGQEAWLAEKFNLSL